MTQETVQLRMDEKALRQSLRFAFANHDTVVQELIQNARRAGASKVIVNYSAETQELFIVDDGCGIDDFSKLMTIGVSGWNQSVAQAEKPYGLGFLAAVYAAKKVAIASKGKCLAFDTDEALDNGSFEVTADPSGAMRTTVALSGFEWKNAQAAIAKMALGYPIPIEFNGLELVRPHALTPDFVKTDIGSVQIASADFWFSKPYVYLQGFLVHKPVNDFCTSGRDVIHLDSTKFLGKFPDRDRVIDEEQMLVQVKVVLRQLYVEKLERMHREMPPEEFCDAAYDLAHSLGRLDIFNDIDVLPAGWLKEFVELPHDSWQAEDVFSDVENLTRVTKQEVRDGAKTIVVLTDEYVANDDDANCKRWLWAYAKRALVLDKGLHGDHWIYELAQVHDEIEVGIEVVNPGASDRIDHSRAEWIGGHRIQLCEKAKLVCEGESIVIAVPFADPTESTIIVPLDGKQPKYVSEFVLKQLEDYRDDETWLEDECSKDADLVNAMAREIAASSPLERAELVLTAALRDFREIAGKAFEIEVNQHGIVTVKSMRDLPATES